jgi:inosine-uridine nucleoside N-ribohydrolase
MKTFFLLNLSVIITFLVVGCQSKEAKETRKTRIIFDTDTNNELDDQHALAYLLFNQSTFQIEGITVNTTDNGSSMEQHYAEAKRVLQLCAADTFPLLRGADKNFKDIVKTLDSTTYDGQDAVDLMINKSLENTSDTLVILAVGKLTTVALAVARDPSIVNRVRLVWLGSNYPEPGEYNQNNDTVAMNYLLNKKVPFEMVTVRYGKLSGTAAVSITQADVNKIMPGLGPRISVPVVGRMGGVFFCFGDYSVDLFKHIDYHSDPPSRSLFDMAAVAIVKNPTWAERSSIPAPILINNQWAERPGNPRKIIVWENFKSRAILDDFISSFPQKK